MNTLLLKLAVKRCRTYLKLFDALRQVRYPQLRSSTARVYTFSIMCSGCTELPPDTGFRNAMRIPSADHSCRCDRLMQAPRHAFHGMLQFTYIIRPLVPQKLIGGGRTTRESKRSYKLVQVVEEIELTVERIERD